MNGAMGEGSGRPQGGTDEQTHQLAQAQTLCREEVRESVDIFRIDACLYHLSLRTRPYPGGLNGTSVPWTQIGVMETNMEAQKNRRQTAGSRIDRSFLPARS